MKKIVAPFLAGSLFLLAACHKQLDQVPISEPSTASFYATPTDFVQAVNAIYNDLRPYPDRQLNLSETRSDNLYAVSEGGVRDWDPINNFQKTIASNPYVIEPWATNYNGIFRANKLLEELAARGATVLPNAAQRTQLEAEARFLRAFFYFDLVRWYGAVPLVEKPVASEAFQIPRSPVPEVYNLILSDLRFAADNLPDVYTSTNDRGRPRKWAAKAWLALVHMTRSGPRYGLQLPSGGITEPGLGLNEWSEALKLLNEVIASNRFSFVADYASIFSYTNENNPEVVFDVQYISGANPILGATFPWVLVPDTWFQSQGKQNQGGLTIRPVSTDLLNAYEPNDSRKSFTILQGYTNQGVPENRPFIKKYVDITRVPTNRVDWPINFIVMRYTDVLMLKAECILRGGTPGSQNEVDNIVNMVRQRASLGPLSNVTLPRLMEEKRKEFVGEGSRWHDLVRSGLVEQVMKAWITKEDVGNQIAPFSTNYIIYPVPQGEIDVQVGLYQQNPGY